MDRSLPEAHLIESCVAGHRAAQKALYDRYCDEMLVLCLRYIANGEDAREVLMDGFLNCFRSIGSFQYVGDGSFRAWLKKIMVNCCLMRLRKRTPAADEIDDASAVGVDDGVLARMSAKEILARIQALPAGYRTVFNLYFFEDCTHREIAGLLGISENTSKSQLAKAKATLQRQLTALS